MATKTTWSKKIRAACEEAGTYEQWFESAIEQLAEILEIRDAIKREYKETGSQPVVQHTNKGGSTNTVKNPLLVLLHDYNAQALAYWRDLGLTPAGFKKLGNDTSSKKETGSFEAILRGIGI